MQSSGPPAYLDAQRLPRKRLLEDTLPKVSGKKEAVRPATPESGEEAQLGYADVLGLVHYDAIKWRILDRRQAGCEPPLGRK